MNGALEELQGSRDELLRLFYQKETIYTFQEDYAEIVDHYFRRNLQESKTGERLFRAKEPFAFVAVGGYGRRDLYVHSDIDLVILFGSKVPHLAKELAREVLYPLWDGGFDLGYAIRDIKDCTVQARDNFEVQTAMIDARFICGDSPLYLSLMDDLEKKIFFRDIEVFARRLEERNLMRMAGFGDASYLLEPHVKEGIGGLRDYHQILWLAKVFFRLRSPRDLEHMGIFSQKEYQDLVKSLRFIGLTRNHLHGMSDRRNDRLTFAYQEKIAQALGFKDQREYLAVEQFLGILHASMATVKSLHQSFILTHSPGKGPPRKPPENEDLCVSFLLHHGEIGFTSPASMVSDPLLMMDIFFESARLNHPISLESKRLIREFLDRIDAGFMVSPRATRGFLDVLMEPNAFEALDQMLETGFLCRFIPEFERIKDRVQFDSYHLFPVGRHSLQTVRGLKNLGREREFLLVDILSDLSDQEPLFLAALFHDIGKTGKNHAHRGAHMTRHILNRWGYDPVKAEDVTFLIYHHLLLVETATRRDLNDEKTIVQCARTIGNINRIKMLYLLTWADGKATGPRAWNEWTANLVLELFLKILHILERGELATPNISRRVHLVQSKVRRGMITLIDPDELDHLLEKMPQRYLMETNPRDIIRHVLIYKGIEEPLKDPLSRTFSLQAEEEISGTSWEVAFLARDKPGIFSDVTGVMALHNLNILSAHIYTWLDGTAVDIFKVSSPPDPYRSEEIWEKVREDLDAVLSGRLSLPHLLDQKARPSILSPSKRPFRPSEVHVDNTSSDFFTIIEIFTNDRVGLLYLISRSLFQLELDIRIAKIATKKDQVADIFYVRNLDGEKVMEEGRVEKIKETLLHELTKGPAITTRG